MSNTTLAPIDLDRIAAATDKIGLLTDFLSNVPRESITERSYAGILRTLQDIEADLDKIATR